MENDDLKIIQSCKRNNRHGYDKLFQKYEKFIYRICNYYASTPEDTLDLMQEVMLRVYNNFHLYNEQKPFLPWLKTVTARTCLNHVRCRKLEMLSLEAQEGKKGYIDQLTTQENVEEQVEYADTQNLIHKAISSLPEEFKIVVILRHIEDLSYEEIAKTLNLPLGTVKTYLFRGRKLLKEKLKQAGLWEVGL